ncbi:hypothetical protein [Sphingomicrobium arenosum]|uniref:hypothetical protein n=1 Tax=Sphingomicrobium arenosum TaxID=2233861 RepID=UPI00223FCB40|nr:hypothetical protein [Sphingomicrobium arenosum]
MLGRPDDAKLLRMLHGAAEDTGQRIRLVCDRIANQQIVKILQDCRQNRDEMMPRIAAALEEIGAPLEDGERRICCPESWFDLSDDATASGNYGPLLLKLAECDEVVMTRLSEAAETADLSAVTRLAIDEAIILLDETIKKFRRIVEQSDGKDATQAA